MRKLGARIKGSPSFVRLSPDGKKDSEDRTLSRAVAARPRQSGTATQRPKRVVGKEVSARGRLKSTTGHLRKKKRGQAIGRGARSSKTHKKKKKMFGRADWGTQREGASKVVEDAREKRS